MKVSTLDLLYVPQYTYRESEALLAAQEPVEDVELLIDPEPEPEPDL